MNPEGQFDRRRLIKGAGLTMIAGAPVLLAACGDEEASSGDTDEANDLKIVLVGQEREFEMVALYTRLLEVAPPSAKPLVQEILTSEQAHATGLSTVITDLGGTPVKPKSDYPEVARLQNWQSGRAEVSRLEAETSGEYIAEIPKLTIGDLRATWTSLATSAGQHITVLGSLPA